MHESGIISAKVNLCAVDSCVSEAISNKVTTQALITAKLAEKSSQMKNKMGLKWHKMHSDCWFADSGELTVGMISKLDNGNWRYNISGVRTKHITKGRGEVKTFESAKRAVKRAWDQWLWFAKLRHLDEKA